jgi:hypothetical protein
MAHLEPEHTSSRRQERKEHHAMVTMTMTMMVMHASCDSLYTLLMTATTESC